MKKTVKKLPEKNITILALIPFLNYFSLIYIGAIVHNWIHIVCGAVYLIASIIFPEAAVFFWCVCVAQYFITYNKIKKQMNTVSPNSTSQQERVEKPVESSPFTDTTVFGTIETVQPIPLRKNVSVQTGRWGSTDSVYNKFFMDMKKFEKTSGLPASFQPFMTYWPSYDSMSRAQRAWYFYWRSQVRTGNYPDTDLSYIFVHIYEILSGIGWEDAQDGYNQMVKLWAAYREKFPKLDAYLYDWTFGFAQSYHLDSRVPLENMEFTLTPSVLTDLLVDSYAQDVPLKLPFKLIDALCEYSLIGSKFYRDGNQALMREAILRVVALADVALRKKTQKGILSAYGPNRPKNQEYYLFRAAVCPDANKKIIVSVKAYSSDERLRSYINELVRFAENTLRALYGYRGRLRGVVLDEETSTLIKAFLKKEYAKETDDAAAAEKKKTEITLDFESIQTLREQSDAVREALQVEEASSSEPKELLTDVAEVTAIYTALTPDARALLSRLKESSWSDVKASGDESRICEINRLAERHLGCALIVCENGRMIAEDDYQDELTYIYEHPPALSSVPERGCEFNLSVLNEELRNFVEMLAAEQREVLYVLLSEKDPQHGLERIAEEQLTMPQMLLDDINETAMCSLGDIVVDAIDTKPHILEEYVGPLKKSIA